MSSRPHTAGSACGESRQVTPVRGPAGAWLAAAVVLLVTLAGPVQAAQTERARWLMGTLWTLTATTTGADSVRAGEGLDAALDSVAALDGLLSNWAPASALSQLNAAGSGEALPEPLFAVIDSALVLAAITDGMFDPTVEALTRAWDLRGKGRVPDARALAAARSRVGWRRIVLDASARRVELNGTQLDLGGIAKGFALDRAAAVLSAHRLVDATLDAGGQWLVLGTSVPVSIAHPAQRDLAVMTIELRDASLSTSAQSERFVRANGRRYGHVLDPRTGRPVATHASVSVQAASATRADALSTALLVLGRASAETFAATHPGIGVLWLEPEPMIVRAWATNLSTTPSSGAVLMPPFGRARTRPAATR